MEWYIYALLFVIAMVTVYLVSWVGNVLHSVPNGGTSGYAVFTFRGDQDRSMSTNILMMLGSKAPYSTLKSSYVL